MIKIWSILISSLIHIGFSYSKNMTNSEAFHQTQTLKIGNSSFLFRNFIFILVSMWLIGISFSISSCFNQTGISFLEEFFQLELGILGYPKKQNVWKTHLPRFFLNITCGHEKDESKIVILVKYTIKDTKSKGMGQMTW